MELEPPTRDPFVGQELAETLYHLLWELVHVFFDHAAGSAAGAGASAFLYPFLERGDADLDGGGGGRSPFGADEGARKSAELRERTLTDGGAS